jgi:two-component sensor histidine kinase
MKQARTRDPTDAAYFQELINLFRQVLKTDELGLTFVPQEGEKAGHTTTVSAEGGSSSARDIAHNYCKQLLDHSNLQSKPPSKQLESLKFISLEGQFKTPIGYLWHSVANLELAHIDYLIQSILQAIETSKKSHFHDVFTQSIEKFTSDELYNNITGAIRKGLYCDDVIIWERRRNMLVSVDRPGMDLTIRGSIAGTAIANSFSRFDDIRNVDKSKIQHYDYIFENGINSAFFFSLNVSSDGDNTPDAVIGVFYCRPYGTTEIDLELCHYAISYYELLWKQQNELERLRKQSFEFEEIKPFYRDAIRSLVDFHDLTAIYFGISSALSDIQILAHNREDILTPAKTASLRMKQFRNLLQKNSNALTAAPAFYEIISATENESTQLVNLRNLFNQELDKIEDEARQNRTKLERNYQLKFTSAVVNKNDYVRVTTNLLTNALRATNRRGRGGGVISATIALGENGKILITVEDNGPGIPSEDLAKIFDVHFTTHSNEGGKGLGLAIVKAIAKKHGGKPFVQSIWGKGAEISVALEYEDTI